MTKNEKQMKIDADGDSSESDIPETLPGIDIDLALSRIGNDRILFKKLLSRFAEHHADSVERILTALESGDQETAARLAHTLKGLAGTIGAMTMQNSARDLEMAIKDGGEELDDLIAAVSQNMVEVLNGLS